MTTRNVEALRDHLFGLLEQLADKDKPVDLERAKVICETAQTIINSAKVENDYMKIKGEAESRFLEQEEPMPPGITSITRHRIGR